MRVFIVQAGWDYEGSRVIGVYASRERAEEAKKVEKAKGAYDFVMINEWEVEE
jgi:hypothetical protein